MPLLSEAEYLATMGARREPLRPEEAAPVDLGVYVRAIDARDLRGHDFSGLGIASAYAIDGGAWRHVLVSSEMPNVYLVLVLDGQANAVYGHRVLDLNERYGLND